MIWSDIFYIHCVWTCFSPCTWIYLNTLNIWYDETRQHSELKRPPRGRGWADHIKTFTTSFPWFLVKGKWIYNDLLFVSRPLIGSNLNILRNKANKISKITAPMTGFVGVWKFGVIVLNFRQSWFVAVRRERNFASLGRHLGLRRPCIQICKLRR
jgi:hypothetical protein